MDSRSFDSGPRAPMSTSGAAQSFKLVPFVGAAGQRGVEREPLVVCRECARVRRQRFGERRHAKAHRALTGQGPDGNAVTHRCREESTSVNALKAFLVPVDYFRSTDELFYFAYSIFQAFETVRTASILLDQIDF